LIFRLFAGSTSSGRLALAVGVQNSSATRVRPVFEALEREDPSGRSWLPTLLRLGGRGSPPADTGELVGGVRLEFAAPPPRDFLRWLVANPNRLRQPSYTTSEAVTTKRAALLASDAAVIAEALREIEVGATHRGKWWCLEGTTYVDCALVTDRIVVFVEGKRTELAPTPKISWYPGRNQMLRNLDCARWYGTQNGLDYYALLIVEDAADDDPRMREARRVIDPGTVEAALPHLDRAAREAVMEHYLGFTTWQRVARELAIGIHFV
jgi:hypothetical protein